MKILALSDNHSKDVCLNLNDFDYIIHSGDRGNFTSDKAVMVKGNCDFEGDKTLFLNIEGKKVLITHGDLYGVKEGLMRISLFALENKVDYVFFGHTHVPTFFEYNGIKFINPGAYLDGRYVILNEDKIVFYKDDKAERIIKNKW